MNEDLDLSKVIARRKNNKTQSLLDHLKGTLDLYMNIEPKIIILLYNRIKPEVELDQFKFYIRLAIGLHDIGKVLPKYQSKASFWCHEVISAAIYKALTSNWDICKLCTHAILMHHQAMRTFDDFRNFIELKLGEYLLDLNDNVLKAIIDIVNLIKDLASKDLDHRPKLMLHLNRSRIIELARDLIRTLLTCKNSKLKMYLLITAPMCVCDNLDANNWAIRHGLKPWRNPIMNYIYNYYTSITLSLIHI